MPKSISKPKKRFRREESRTQSRATLIAVGREYFLRYCLGGAVAEKIAEDDGYLRSTLYANFDGKDELFLAVIRDEQDRRMQAIHSMFKEEPSAKERP
jgi:AcrR family transcriptional regulator